MFTFFNVLLVAGAFLVVLVIAAMSSLPSRDEDDVDPPRGERVRPAPTPAVYNAGFSRDSTSRPVPMAPALRQSLPRQP